MLAMSTSDFLWYVDHALDEMVSIVVELGDDDANARPDLPGANSPYVILAHCIGVIEYWAGRVVAGRAVERDRDAEFRASGPVADLARRASEARRQLEADLSALDSLAPPRSPDPKDAELPFGRTQGGVLMHIFEELAQHLGHLELTRDVLRDARSARAT